MGMRGAILMSMWGKSLGISTQINTSKHPRLILLSVGAVILAVLAETAVTLLEANSLF